MVISCSAIYEKGVLRLLEPLDLREQQQVTVTVNDSSAEDWLDHEFLAILESERGPIPSLDEVRAVLSTIPGNLSDDIRRERDERG